MTKFCGYGDGMGRHSEAVTRTFRINREILDVLEAEAERESLSASALLNRILQRYVENTLWGDKYNWVNLSASSFSRLIGTLREDEAYQLGRESAGGEKEGIIDFVWKGRTLEDFLQFVERNYGTYSGWFRGAHQANDDKYMFVATHGFDRSWSFFVAGYLQALLQAVQGVEAEYRIMGNSVTFTFDKGAE